MVTSPSGYPDRIPDQMAGTSDEKADILSVTMVAAIKQTVTVEPGGIVRVTSAQLEVGARAEVIVLVEGVPVPATAAPLASFIGAARGAFSSVEEIDAHIRQERDEWDR
jgi:hypothetical protein